MPDLINFSYCSSSRSGDNSSSIASSNSSSSIITEVSPLHLQFNTQSCHVSSPIEESIKRTICC